MCVLVCIMYCRGYGDTEKPPHKKDYHLDKLTQDIAELIPALGYSTCVLVAHDWGGTVGWYREMWYYYVFVILDILIGH